MFFKALALHSVSIAGIATSLVTQQAVPRPVTFAGLAAAAEQITNRSGKADKLPMVLQPRLTRSVPLQQHGPRPDKVDCKPPIDVPGRCFAESFHESNTVAARDITLATVVAVGVA